MEDVTRRSFVGVAAAAVVAGAASVTHADEANDNGGLVGATPKNLADMGGQRDEPVGAQSPPP